MCDAAAIPEQNTDVRSSRDFGEESAGKDTIVLETTIVDEKYLLEVPTFELFISSHSSTSARLRAVRCHEMMHIDVLNASLWSSEVWEIHDETKHLCFGNL
ncbi:uncharacterized protein EAF01_007236 [Botrytis porri]|uniref:uncharacterized protein n=1 Tax=Botrytis porri TaxID=87229 RepID=UPI0019029C91|nr:uncharacterized protein EAF01_007236 [Botrytis porri]KAF7901938.1 hypothetical protein EAF01_007236 [Botrytis porri]